MRIMYVEDNPANLFLVQRVARMGNHEVLNYTTGESALENFERDHPDLVLMDVQLAGAMNGLDVVRKLRGSGYSTPIIAVTAYAMVGDRERCLEAGCTDYLSKPLPVPKLVELITRYDPLKQGDAAPVVPASVAPVPAAAPAPTAVPAADSAAPAAVPASVAPAPAAVPAPAAAPAPAAVPAPAVAPADSAAPSVPAATGTDAAVPVSAPPEPTPVTPAANTPAPATPAEASSDNKSA